MLLELPFSRSSTAFNGSGYLHLLQTDLYKKAAYTLFAKISNRSDRGKIRYFLVAKLLTGIKNS